MRMDNPFEEPKRHKTKLVRKVIPRTKYWVWGTMPNGKRFVLGGYDSQMEAEQAGNGKSDNYEVVPLKTVDVNRAVQMLKARDLHKYDSIEQSIEPVQRS